MKFQSKNLENVLEENAIGRSGHHYRRAIAPESRATQHHHTGSFGGGT